MHKKKFNFFMHFTYKLRIKLVRSIFVYSKEGSSSFIPFPFQDYESLVQFALYLTLHWK